jgi:hypothetical protein
MAIRSCTATDLANRVITSKNSGGSAPLTQTEVLSANATEPCLAPVGQQIVDRKLIHVGEDAAVLADDLEFVYAEAPALPLSQAMRNSRTAWLCRRSMRPFYLHYVPASPHLHPWRHRLQHYIYGYCPGVSDSVKSR